MRKPLVLIGTLVFAACSAGESPIEPEIIGDGKVDGLLNGPSCAERPEAAVYPQMAQYKHWSMRGTVYVAPARPRPGNEIFVIFHSPSSFASVTARYTADRWASQQDVRLDDWKCDVPSGGTVYGASLGAHPTGTPIELAIHFKNYAYDEWYENQGANFRVDVSPPEPLSWAGDTRLAYGGLPIATDLIAAGRPLQVYTQTYPQSTNATVELSWQTRSGTKSSVRMVPAGTFGNNDQWVGEIPTQALVDGEELKYWIRAVDGFGNERHDSANGANFSITPRTFTVGWIGGFGSYRPSSGAYLEGGLFTGLSTSTGCVNQGVGLSGYRSRAVRVYVPGLTDRSYANADERRAAASLLQVAVWSPRGSWPLMSSRMLAQVGDDFVYGMLEYTDLCNGGGGGNVRDGVHPYHVVASTDSGSSWAVRGESEELDGVTSLSANVVGAFPLAFTFAVNGSYWN
jgi:hypothetical protein